MAAARRQVIVTGATGKQGGAFIQALVSKPSQPFDIYAVTRNASSKGAQALAKKPNVKVIEGDFDNPKAIFAQVPNAWGVFLMTTPVIGKKDSFLVEERQGKALIDAAVEAKIAHLVMTSVDRGVNSDTNETPVPHFGSKKRVEDHLKAKKGLSWTIVRPAAFMDNLSNDMVGKIFMTAWRQNGMDTKLQLISTMDVGRIAAEAMLGADKKEYLNKSISIAGDDLTPRQAAVAFKQVTGQDVPSTFGIFATVAKMMVPDELGKMFKWFVDEGYAADVPALRKEYPFLRSFEQWVATESAWKKNSA